MSENIPSTWPMEHSRVVSHGEHGGIVWVTAYAPIYGAVNGYALVPEGHPWRAIAEQDDPMDAYDLPVSTGGGITYAKDGWIGFDTMHYNDYWPGMPSWGYVESADMRSWTPELVVEEVQRLCDVIREAETANA